MTPGLVTQGPENPTKRLLSGCPPVAALSRHLKSQPPPRPHTPTSRRCSALPASLRRSPAQGEAPPFLGAVPGPQGLTRRPRAAPCRRRRRTQTAPAGGARSRTPAARARPRAAARPRVCPCPLTNATLVPGRGAEPWRVARGASAEAASLGASRARTAAMAVQGQQVGGSRGGACAVSCFRSRSRVRSGALAPRSRCFRCPRQQDLPRCQLGRRRGSRSRVPGFTSAPDAAPSHRRPVSERGRA